MSSCRRRWLEWSLAAAVIALATSALVIERSLADAAERTVHDLSHRLGKNMLLVPEGLDLKQFYEMDYGPQTLPESTARSILDSELGAHIGFAQMRLYANLRRSGTELVLVGERSWMRRRKEELAPGQAIVAAPIAKKLNLSRGGSFTLGGQTLTVKNILKAPPDGLDTAVFTSLPTAQRITKKPDAVTALRLGGCWCRVDVPTLAGKVQRRTPGSRAITVAGVVQAQKGVIADVKRYSTAVRGVAYSLIILLIAALVANQARRQRREIGLLVALGAGRRLLLLIFIAPAITVGLLAAIGGFYLGIPATVAATARLVGGSGAPPPEGIAPAIVAMVAIACTLAAYLPAMLASRTDPTEVLSDA